jgi:molybdate transport system substrate-binding protein
LRQAWRLVLLLAPVLMGGCRPGAPTRTALTVRGGPLLRNVFTEIGVAFTRQHPEIDLRADFSCPPCVLTSRIREGIDLDVFVSAGDVEFDELAKAGIVDRSTREPIGTVRLVLVVPESNPGHVRGLGDLLRPEVSSVALGDTEATSPGHYTRQAFERMGLWNEVKPKLLTTKTGCEALKAVVIGKAEAAVLYAFCLEDEAGRPRVISDIPERLHDPVIVAVSRSPKAPKEAARAFADFLKSPDAQALLQRYRISPVPE